MAMMMREPLVERANNNLNSDAAAAASDVTPFLLLSTIVAAATTFSYGCNVGFTASTQNAIMEDLGLSVAEFSFFASALTAGTILGSLISGKTADFFGRKCTLCILNLFYILGWVLIASAKGTWLLDLARLLLGISSGISGFLTPMYVAEIAPSKLRGIFTAVLPLAVIWGISLMDLIGPFVNWRVLALIGAVPNLLQIPLLYFIPESPRWLIQAGKQKEFEAALMCLRGKDSDISQEAADIINYNESLKLIHKKYGLDLFEKKYARHLLIGIGLFVFQNLDGMSAYTFYSSVIFTSAGISTSTGLVLLAAVQTSVGVLGAILVDKSGRRSLLLVSAAGLCLSTFVTGLSFLLQQRLDLWKQVGPTLELTCVLVYMGFNVLGVGGIPWIIVAEIFPMNIKGLAGSICCAIGSLTSLVVTYSFNFLIQWSLAGTFFIFSALCFGTLIFVARFVPETKGRTLEEIHESITTTHPLR